MTGCCDGPAAILMLSRWHGGHAPMWELTISTKT
jgi:hypothetical protein